jgi:hypothetical protein
MGYSTDFDGQFRITPPLPTDLIDQLNEFCATRHEKPSKPEPEPWESDPNNLNRPYRGKLADPRIGIWCDWAFRTEADATVMEWNGNEKSYHQAEWGQHLISLFPEGHTVTGTINAQGEDANDIWRMVAKDRTITVQEPTITWPSS